MHKSEHEKVWKNPWLFTQSSRSSHSYLVFAKHFLLLTTFVESICGTSKAKVHSGIESQNIWPDYGWVSLGSPCQEDLTEGICEAKWCFQGNPREYCQGAQAEVNQASRGRHSVFIKLHSYSFIISLNHKIKIIIIGTLSQSGNWPSTTATSLWVDPCHDQWRWHFQVCHFVCIFFHV